MYISKIELKNIRGFKNLEFELVRPDDTYAGWTVFTGDNGSGKSSLLKAIAVGLTGKETARALQPNFQTIGFGAERAKALQTTKLLARSNASIDSGSCPKVSSG